MKTFEWHFLGKEKSFGLVYFFKNSVNEHAYLHFWRMVHFWILFQPGETSRTLIPVTLFQKRRQEHFLSCFDNFSYHVRTNASFLNCVNFWRPRRPVNNYITQIPFNVIELCQYWQERLQLHGAYLNEFFFSFPWKLSEFSNIVVIRSM